MSIGDSFLRTGSEVRKKSPSAATAKIIKSESKLRMLRIDYKVKYVKTVINEK